MASKPYSSMQTPADIAAKYGDKQDISQAVAQGIVDPTIGMLAGMVIDRIRAPRPQPQSTVAQKVMGGLGATPQAQQMGMPLPQAPAAAPARAPAPAPAQTMMAASGGLMDLPVDDAMFDYAGGGVVAFAAGDSVPRFEDLPIAGGDAKVPGNQISSFFSSIGGTERRIDPITGEAVTLGEYLRRVDQRKARAAMPAAQQQVAAVPTPPSLTPPGPAAGGPGPGAAPAAPPIAAPQAAPTPAAAPAAPFKLPEKQTPQQFLAQQKEFGIDDKLNEKLLADAEKLGGTAEDKERAIAMAIIRGSLGAMAGTSPNAILNVAQGFAAGVDQYAKDYKDIRTAERDLGKIKIELAKAEDARKRGNFKEYNESINKAQTMAMDLEKLNLEARRTAATEEQAKAYGKSINKPSTFAEQMEAFRRDPKGFEAFRKALGSSDETEMLNRRRYADAALAADTEYLRYANSKKPEDQLRAKQIRDKKYQEYGVTSVGSSGGKTLQWSDIQ